MKPFIYTGLPSRVVFGVGSVAQLPAEVARLGAKRVLMLSTPGRAAMVRELAKGVSIAGVFDKAVMHTPLELANEARELARRLEADCCVAVGGGSTIGFGKAIALTSGLPVIAVPTTYSGSEMTTIWGLAEGGLKKTGRDPKVLPKTVIYDPSLTLDLPPAVSAARDITRWPMPLSPSTIAVAGAERDTVMFGCLLKPPALRRRTYCGRRKMP